MTAKRWSLCLILLMQCVVAQATSPEVCFSTYVYTSSMTVAHAPVDYIFQWKGKTVLKIDKDGDIFLRGKWVGWDGRLREIIRRTW